MRWIRLVALPWLVASAGCAETSGDAANVACHVQLQPDDRCALVARPDMQRSYDTALQLLAERGADVPHLVPILLERCEEHDRVVFADCSHGSAPLVLGVRVDSRTGRADFIGH